MNKTRNSREMKKRIREKKREWKRISRQIWPWTEGALIT